jgi:hypothetical protein
LNARQRAAELVEQRFRGAQIQADARDGGEILNGRTAGADHRARHHIERVEAVRADVANADAALERMLAPQPRQVVTELVDGRDAPLRVVVVELALPLRTPGKKRKMPRRAGSV